MKVRGSTFIAPPEEKKGHKAVFEGDEFREGQWKKVDDFRGTWYRKSDGAPLVVSSLGVAPDIKSYTRIPRPGPEYAWDEKAESWVMNEDLAASVKAAQIKASIMNYAAERLMVAHLVELGWMDEKGNVIISKIPKEFK